ncbi:pyruvate oxidase [Paenibacillus swuensis]|uniref:Pyruvate oxidase n=1 Tax=Paenibacillus swuensis TaxID=1178515 RepID=A0A172TPY7_9BACL|nr:pyruvate oxidase [Paenibacillus swuensis]
MTVAEFIVKQLTAWDVRRIYGVIGDANLYLLDELSKQTQIQYVACRHECAAALMASAEAKLTGRVGVCLATSGPGIANLMNGLGDAMMDGAGVLAITGQVEATKIGTDTKQYIDQQRLLAAVAPYSALLTHADALPYILHKALIRSFTMGEVTHLSVPKDLYGQKVQGQVHPYQAHLHQPVRAPREEVRAVAQLLRDAERPMLLLGRGAADAAGDAVALAELASACVTATMPARALFPNDHRLFAGGLGQAGSEAASALLAASDLVVVLGATWWPEDYVPAAMKLVQVDLNRAAIGLGHPLHKGVVGDLGHFVPALLRELRDERRDRSAWETAIAEAKQSWLLRMERECEGGIPSDQAGNYAASDKQDIHSNQADGSVSSDVVAQPVDLATESHEGIPPQRVMRILSRLVAEDAVITVDTGDHSLWFNRIFQARAQDILISGTWRTLGWALPAAIAAQLAEPERQVVAVAGDGGVVQTLLEFVTAVELELPITLVVLNNGSYSMERNRMLVSGLSTEGSRILNPSFTGIAEACGGRGYLSQTAEQFETDLKEALASPQTSLIEVMTADPIVPHTKI